jgi:hypothetical protein
MGENYNERFLLLIIWANGDGDRELRAEKIIPIDF